MLRRDGKKKTKFTKIHDGQRPEETLHIDKKKKMLKQHQVKKSHSQINLNVKQGNFVRKINKLNKRFESS